MTSSSPGEQPGDWIIDEDEERERANNPNINPLYLYVNAYAVSRCYGGPEEGGWWYDSGRPLASVPVTYGAPTEFISHYLETLLGWKNRDDRYSVLGGEDFVVYVERKIATEFPESTPHYE